MKFLAASCFVLLTAFVSAQNSQELNFPVQGKYYVTTEASLSFDAISFTKDQALAFQNNKEMATYKIVKKDGENYIVREVNNEAAAMSQTSIANANNMYLIHFQKGLNGNYLLTIKAKGKSVHLTINKNKPLKQKSTNAQKLNDSK